MISVDEKKEFIRYILNNYQFKIKQSVWILNFILSNDNILQNVYFVRNVKHYPKGILMSTNCSNNAPFRFYNKDRSMTTDAERAFHSIRLFPNEELYVQLSFENVETDEYYNAIVEDDEKYDVKLQQEKQQILSEMDNFLYRIDQKHKLNNLYKEIDTALDNRDEKLFYELTNKLNELLAF